MNLHSKFKVPLVIQERQNPQDRTEPAKFYLQAVKSGNSDLRRLAYLISIQSTVRQADCLAVLRRPGHTEAAVDLTVLAGLKPGGVIVEIMNEDGTMARLPQLREIADKFDLKLVTIQDLIAYRLQHESLIERIEEFPIKTFFGDYQLITFRQKTNEQIHFALVKGEWNEEEAVPVRVKSTNSYYDLFSSLQFGETPLLKRITEIIDEEGKGAIVFINNIVSSDLIQAKVNQFKDFQIGDQQTPLLKPDSLDYGTGAQIIKDLGITNIKLITQSPNKKRSLSGYDLEIVDYIQI